MAASILNKIIFCKGMNILASREQLNDITWTYWTTYKNPVSKSSERPNNRFLFTAQPIFRPCSSRNLSNPSTMIHVYDDFVGYERNIGRIVWLLNNFSKLVPYVWTCNPLEFTTRGMANIYIFYSSLYTLVRPLKSSSLFAVSSILSPCALPSPCERHFRGGILKPLRRNKTALWPP